MVELSLNSTYRFLTTLKTCQYVEQDPKTRRYRLGLQPLVLAGNILNRLEIYRQAMPHLKELAEEVGERVNLGVLHRGGVLYLCGAEKPSYPVYYTQQGKQAPIHCSALGKVILAYLPMNEADFILSQVQLTPVTPNTITCMDVLKRELIETLQRGYALDHEEHIPGIRCIAAPIRGPADEVLAGISISVPSQFISSEALVELLPILQAKAGLISYGMGWLRR